MFTFEIRINGSLIAHIYGHNEGEIDKKGQTKYSYEYYEPTTRRIVSGTVRHKRGDGIRPLVTTILKDIPPDERIGH